MRATDNSGANDTTSRSRTSKPCNEGSARGNSPSNVALRQYLVQRLQAHCVGDAAATKTAMGCGALLSKGH